MRRWFNRTAGLINNAVWLSMAIVCSYYAGQLDQLDGTLTFKVLTDHLYNTLLSFYGGTIFQAIVWVFCVTAIGCWIRAFRTNDQIDACEVAISVIASILCIVSIFLPGSEKEFWTGNVPYTFLVVDVCLLFGCLYHWIWGVVVFWLYDESSTTTGTTEGKPKADASESKPKSDDKKD